MVAIAATANATAAGHSLAGRRPDNGKISPRELEFLRDLSTGRVAVKSTDVNTGKVRTIPPVQMLRTLAGIRRAIGLLLDRSG